MKKVSTATAKQSRNFSQQKLTIGLDLGDRSSYYCMVDESGCMVAEQKISATPKVLQAVFGAIPRSRVALETGMHSSRRGRNLEGPDPGRNGKALRTFRSWRGDDQKSSCCASSNGCPESILDLDEGARS